MKRVRCLGRLFFVSCVVLGIALHFLPRDIAFAQLRSETLPLADLHFHPGPLFWPNHTPEEILRVMDRAGVRWAGNGTSGAPDDHWASLVQTASGRFIPLAGQDPIRALILSQGEEAWSLRSPEITRYLERLEEHLRARQFLGIGELFVNNRNSRPPTAPESRYPADSPLMRRLFRFAVTYQVPLSIHMDAEPTSVEELERLLATDRKGTVIWAHCGHAAGDASVVRRLLAQHPNLLCELSGRDDRSRPNPEVRRRIMITNEGRQLQSEWKALLEDYSDRFLVGTDSANPGQYQGIVDFFRAVLAQLTPEAARRIAHGNALRLFRLSQ
ncbi:MAG: amidohydrolase family protein [Thermoanaerobaculia bacterium]